MDTITLHAHFDGKQIRLDEPYKLEPNAKLLVTVLPKQYSDSEQEEWLRLSKNALENAYAEDEIQYSLDLIKEANPEYERR
ncbi:MAG: hypothetical protein ACREX3_13095 [Gammaproteobacteria bacterium]